MQPALSEIEQEFLQYEGVKTEAVDGGLLSHDGDRRTDLRVTIPCQGGRAFDFTLQEETAVGVIMSCKAFNNHGGGLNEQLIIDMVACYEMKPILNKKGA